LRFARGNGGEGILEDAAGERLMLREGFLAGDMRIGSGLALEGDFFRAYRGQLQLLGSPAPSFELRRAEYWHGEWECQR
jgi:hypothetical protein